MHGSARQVLPSLLPPVSKDSLLTLSPAPPALLDLSVCDEAVEVLSLWEQTHREKFRGRSDMHGTVQSVGAAADGLHGPHRSCWGCNQLGAEHKSPRTNGDRAPSNIYSCMEPPASPVPSEVSALIVPEVSVFEDVVVPPTPSASTHCGCFACFTRRVTNGWTRLSYKRHVRTIFVFLLLFTM